LASFVLCYGNTWTKRGEAIPGKNATHTQYSAVRQKGRRAIVPADQKGEEEQVKVSWGGKEDVIAHELLGKEGEGV